MAIHLLVLLKIILLLCRIKASVLPWCEGSCGDVHISYPLGIGEGCYFDKSFEVICDYSSGSPKAFHKGTKLELLNFNASDNSTKVFVFISNIIPLNGSNSTRTRNADGVNLSGTPFSFSQTDNRFTAIGCDNYAMINNLVNNDSTIFGGCFSVCTCDPNQYGGCFDFLCTIPPNLKVFHANTSYIYSQSILQKCTSVFMVYQDWLFSNYLTNPKVLKDKEQAAAVLEWGKTKGTCVADYNSTNKHCNLDGYCLIQLGSGYVCLCSGRRSSAFPQMCAGQLVCNTTSGYNCSGCPRGYRLVHSYSDQEPQCHGSIGDSYLTSRKFPRAKIIFTACTFGAAGMIFLTIGGRELYKFIKRRKEFRLKQKFFKKNGGLLLQQELSSNEGNIEKIKVFTSQELERATDNFHANRILGQGGQGTVYKGMLVDGRIVAVKKSKVVDESKVEEFINEVVILSQINHRNVVKLLGCCLETEVPLLVFEFIPNGNLFEHIQAQNQEFPLTWEMRLRIATEASGALSYLHSAASVPIYHRDVKSTNILLDHKYQAKVSDFGISRSIAVDQTHLTTHVHGTFGYLDPQYFRSSQFTDKSDVYSFGVVLAELLTGEKPIRLINSEEDRSLAAYFLCSMKQNRLFEILDALVQKEGREGEIITVAEIAMRCLNQNGKNRPTMKEVARELAGITAWNGASIMQDNLEEIHYPEGYIASSRHFDTTGSSSSSGSAEFFDSANIFVDADPLNSNKW